MLSLQAVTMAPSTEMSLQERDELVGQLKVGNVSLCMMLAFQSLQFLIFVTQQCKSLLCIACKVAAATSILKNADAHSAGVLSLSFALAACQGLLSSISVLLLFVVTVSLACYAM